MKKLRTGPSNDLESCSKCSDNHPLKTEIENLKQRLIDRNIAIVQMEANMSQELPYSQGQLATLRASCDSWQDKYDRLLEAHKRIQRVNQGLEDKLLRLVDRSESEKAKLAQDSINLTTALTTAAQAINRLKCENARYQNDLGIAVQLLQCNSSQYTSQKLNMLPHDLHQKIKSKIAPEIKLQKPKSEPKVIRVPIPTFPPTAMVYSVNKVGDDNDENDQEVDVVSAAIMAAILEEREREKSQRHCPTCTCKLPIETNHSNNSMKNLDCDTLGSNDDFHNRPNQDISKVVDNGNGSYFEHTLQPCHRSSSFGVNAIDVGTQTIPSYIGETGKVRSTCIYCQSRKANGDKGDTNVSIDSLSLSQLHKHERDCHLGKPSFTQEKLECKQHLSWDWHAESQDSGSPPTPTSLSSASMSYESETSCFTSPQESPGRISLHSARSACRSHDDEKINFTTERDLNHLKITETNSVSDKLSSEKYLFNSGMSIQNCNKLNGKHPKLQVNKYWAPSFPNVQLEKQCSNINHISSFRIPFKSSSSDKDDFTIPIHMSPPLRRSVSDAESLLHDSTPGNLLNNKTTPSHTLDPNNVYHIDHSDSISSSNNVLQHSGMLQTKMNPSSNILKELVNDSQSFYDDTMKSIDIVISSLKGSSLEDFAIDSNNFKNNPVIVASTFTRSATETTL